MENDETNEEAAARAAAQSFRTDTEDRLKKLEAGTVTGTVDGDSQAGIVRTLGDRMTQLEVLQAENVSAILRLAEVVEALKKEVQALKPNA